MSDSFNDIETVKNVLNTKYGINTPQDLYDKLDECIKLEKDSEYRARCAEIYLQRVLFYNL